MKKMKKRKGFTLTELAIVIAVIAILIAVLVPTFTSLINSAKLSADEQATKNMNTALSTSEATDGKPSNLAEAQAVLKEAGFSTELVPTTSGYYYYWNSEYNIVMLIDVSGDEWKLTYPTTDDSGNAYTVYQSYCYNLNAKGTTITQDEILAKVKTGDTISIGSSDYSYSDIVELANTYGETFEGATIELTSGTSVTIDSSEDTIKIFSGTFDGNDQTITVSANAIETEPGEDGNGYLYYDYYNVEEGVQKSKYGFGLFATVTDGAVVKNLTVNYSDTEDGAKSYDPNYKYTYFGGIAGALNGGTISNCKVTGTIVQYNRVGGIVGTALDGTIENCTVEASITALITSVDNGNYSYAGGIVAYAGNALPNNYSLDITDCTVGTTTTNSDQSITGTYAAGGIVACVTKGMKNVTVSDNTIENVTITQNNSTCRVGAVCGIVTQTGTLTLNGTITISGVTVKKYSSGTTLETITAGSKTTDRDYLSETINESTTYLIVGLINTTTDKYGTVVNSASYSSGS